YGEVVIESVHWRFLLYAAEGRQRADHRPRPQTSVEILLAGMTLVVTRPLQAVHGFQARIAHSGVDRTQAAQLVPDFLRSGMTQIAVHAACQIAQDFNVIA